MKYSRFLTFLPVALSLAVSPQARALSSDREGAALFNSPDAARVANDLSIIKQYLDQFIKYSDRLKRDSAALITYPDRMEIYPNPSFIVAPNPGLCRQAEKDLRNFIAKARTSADENRRELGSTTEERIHPHDLCPRLEDALPTVKERSGYKAVHTQKFRNPAPQ
jgi:hypothetical protein